MTVALISNPSFKVNLLDNRRDFSKPLSVIKIPYYIGKSAYHTVRFYSKKSFQKIVLEDQAVPGSILYKIVKVVSWIMAMAWHFPVKFVKYFAAGWSSRKSFGQIDPRHLKSHEKSIDASHVPPEIQMDSLMEIFNQLNLNNPRAPGYVKVDVIKSNLRDGLQKLINHVNMRIAQIGTPPGTNQKELGRFYKKIENFIRVAIYNHQKKLDEFKGVNEQEYWIHFQAMGRMVVDLALGGSYCGSRHTSEAMRAYFESIQGSVGVAETLEDALGEILTEKRFQIAEQQIEKFFNHSNSGYAFISHGYTQYMQHLGHELGLPGASSVKEHLSKQGFDTHFYKREFFKEYSDEEIYSAINEKVKTSQEFRERIYDWVTDQMGNWNPMTKVKKDLEKQINLILRGRSSVNLEDTTIGKFIDLISQLKGELPAQEGGWDSFIQELFQLREVKEWCARGIDVNNRLELLGTRERLKQGFLKLKLDGEITEEHLNKERKIVALNRVFIDLDLDPPSRDVLTRIVLGQTRVSTVVQAQVNQLRKALFLKELGLEGKQLPQKVLEWILVQNHILQKQKKEGKEKISKEQMGKNIDQLLRMFPEQGDEEVKLWLESLKNGDPEVIDDWAEMILSRFTKCRRYSLHLSPHQELINHIFLKYDFKVVSLRSSLKTRVFKVLDRLTTSTTVKLMANLIDVTKGIGIAIVVCHLAESLLTKGGGFLLAEIAKSFPGLVVGAFRLIYLAAFIGLMAYNIISLMKIVSAKMRELRTSSYYGYESSTLQSLHHFFKGQIAGEERSRVERLRSQLVFA